MRRRTTLEPTPAERELAIALAWGHLNAYQYDDAYELARGCLELWPDDEPLQLLCGHAAAEVLEPVDAARLCALRSPANAEWVDLVLRRARGRGTP